MHLKPVSYGLHKCYHRRRAAHMKGACHAAAAIGERPCRAVCLSRAAQARYKRKAHFEQRQDMTKLRNTHRHVRECRQQLQYP